MPGPLIEPPPCVEPRFGLMSVADLEDVPDGHWQGKEGYQTDLESCDQILVLSEKCAPTPENKEDSLDGINTTEGESFTLIAGYECSVAGRDTGRAWDYAERRLTQGEGRALERTFWTGQDSKGNAVPQGLGSENSDLFDVTATPGTAMGITDGLALLESWTAENMPCAPIVHAARGLGTFMAHLGLIEYEGRTHFLKGTGSRLAIGGGYLATGPEGIEPDPGEGWLFATGSVKILRSPAFFTPERGDLGGAVNRDVNDIQVYAERTYGFVRACGIAAVLVKLQSCC